MCCNAVPHVRRRGFSLMEIMVVLVILGLLAGLITVNVRGRLQTARQNVAKTEIATLLKTVEEFYTLVGRYPTNDEGLGILARKSDKTAEPLLKAIPPDPWGNPYEYRKPGRNSPYEIVSLGADGLPGGNDADADITSNQLQERQRAK